jgi:hypothetical protein
VRAAIIADPAWGGRDPDGYCWPCSPRFANHRDFEYRIESILTFGDCVETCAECPYRGHVLDRKNLLANKPLAALRKQYVDMAIDVMRFVELCGYERPKFEPWARDPQPQFWRHMNTPIRYRKHYSSNADFKAIKAQHDLRIEWEKLYDSCVTHSGKSWKAYCPFHSAGTERNPSMRVYQDHYHCYTCNEHGDVIDVLMYAGRLSDAIRNVR